jgi:lipopolysaccharide export system protein LptA
MFLSFLFYLSILPLCAENITFTADSMSGEKNGSNNITTLLGHAYIKTNDIEIKADKIDLSGKDYQFINASGNISGISNENGVTFSCSNMEYDRKTKIAILDTDAKMIDTDNDVTVEAQHIHYDQKLEISTMQMSVTITQKTSKCTSSFAIYRKKQKTLELSGSPKIVKDEDVYTAQEIIMNIETEEMILDGKVTGTVTQKEEDKQEENNTEPPKSNNEKKGLSNE